MIQPDSTLPRKENKVNTPPLAALPFFYLRSILHGAVSPLPLYNSLSFASTTAPRLLLAVIILHLCRRIRPPPLPPHICWLLFFVVVVSVIVAPLPQTIHCVSSAAVVLHLIRRCPQPHPTIVTSCRCACCALVDCCLLPSSSTSSYCHCYSAAVHAMH